MALNKIYFTQDNFSFIIPNGVSIIKVTAVGGGGGAACITEEDNDSRDRHRPQTGGTGGNTTFSINSVVKLTAAGGTGGKAYWNTDTSGHEYTNGWYAHSEKGIGGAGGNDGKAKISRENVIELTEGGYGFELSSIRTPKKDGYGQGGSIQDVGRTSGEGHDHIRIVGSGGSGGYQTQTFTVNPGDVISGQIGTVGSNAIFNDSQVSSKNFIGVGGCILVEWDSKEYKPEEKINPTDIVVTKDIEINTNFVHSGLWEAFGVTKKTGEEYGSGPEGDDGFYEYFSIEYPENGYKINKIKDDISVVFERYSYVSDYDSSMDEDSSCVIITSPTINLQGKKLTYYFNNINKFSKVIGSPYNGSSYKVYFPYNVYIGESGIFKITIE